MPSARALIIDDNPINLELLELLVEAEGFEVTGVAGAEEAMTVLDIFVPELFIVDVQLPGMSGLDLLRLLRSRPDTAKACAIIVTSYAMDADRENAFAAGCDGYITKPIDTRTFGAEIVAIYTDTIAQNSQRH